ILNLDAAALVSLLDDAHLGSENLLELAGCGFDVGVLGRLVFGGIGAFVCKTSYYSLDIADRLAVRRSPVGDLNLPLFVRHTEDRTGVAHVQPTLGQEELDRFGQTKQAKEVGDGGAILAGTVGDFLVS